MVKSVIRTEIGNIYETPHTVEEIEDRIDEAFRNDYANFFGEDPPEGHRVSVVLKRVNPDSVVAVHLRNRDDLEIEPR